MSDKYIPNLRGKIDPDVEVAIHQLYNHMYELRDAKANVKDVITKAAHGTTLDAIQRQMAQNPAYGLLGAGDSTSLKNQGSVLPIIIGALSYTNGGNNIDWSGSGLQELWPNKDVDTLPNFSQPVATLTLSTTYFFYPRVNLRSNMIELAVAPGGVGTPVACAYTARNSVAASMQSYDGYAGISIGGISAATTGGGAGPGGSGGGSGCIWEEMVAETPSGKVIPFKDVHRGSIIMGPSGPNVVTYRAEVLESEWIIIRCGNGERLIVTPTHGMTWHGTTKHAMDWSLADLITARDSCFVQAEEVSKLHKVAKAVAISCAPDKRFYFGERTAWADSHNLPMGK